MDADLTVQIRVQSASARESKALSCVRDQFQVRAIEGGVFELRSVFALELLQLGFLLLVLLEQRFQDLLELSWSTIIQIVVDKKQLTSSSVHILYT